MYKTLSVITEQDSLLLKSTRVNSDNKKKNHGNRKSKVTTFFVLAAVNHLLVDPTYNLSEALYSIIFLFCNTLIITVCPKRNEDG